MTQKPTVGASVLYYPHPGSIAQFWGAPLPAIIVAVIAEDKVNLAVFDANGSVVPTRNVPFHSEGTPPVHGYASFKEIPQPEIEVVPAKTKEKAK